MFSLNVESAKKKIETQTRPVVTKGRGLGVRENWRNVAKKV